jgi:hypothetical protein
MNRDAHVAAKIERYEKALREIGLPAHVPHVPRGFDPLDWWRHTACKRGEIARDALGVTAEDLIRDQWEEAVPRV